MLILSTYTKMGAWKFCLLLCAISAICWAKQEPNAVSIHPENDQLEQDNGVTIENEMEGEQISDEVFVPTKEWQTVKPDQSIPKGLHVRMNLQTGLKEAKLLSDDNINIKETNTENVKAVRLKEEIERAVKELENAKNEEPKEEDLKFWKLGDRQGMMNKKEKKFSRQELKDALKKFKATSGDFSDNKESQTNKKFRQMEDIKKDFEKLNVGIKTDLEILRELYEKYKRNDLTVKERKSVLTDLEYYLHQIDNAQDYSEMGGLQLVIRDLNHTQPDIRSEAAFVLGSALQSNPKVQIKVIQESCMQRLIQMLVSEHHMETRTRVMYALSSLVRHFPHAQEKFVKLGGLTAMSKLFSEQGTEKLQVKAITLVHDLLTEKKTTMENHDPNDSLQKEKLRQYNTIPLAEMLVEQGWCELIPSLLRISEHDTREKVLTAMTDLVENCRPAFVKTQSLLTELKAEYERLSAEEKQEQAGDDYFQGLHNTVTNIISQISIRDEL